MSESIPKTSGKRYLSFTKPSTYLRCPRQYAYKYEQRIEVPSSGAMALGRVWHKTLERNYRQKIASHTDLPLSGMREFFSARLDETFQGEEITFEPGEKPGKLKDQGIAIVAAHHKAIAPSVKPLLVEERFTVNLGADFPFDLVGVWDLIEQDGSIIDSKSYKRIPSQEDIDEDLQLTCYSLAYRATNGTIEPELRLDIVTKTATPEAVQRFTKRLNADCRWFLGLVEQVAQAILAEAFFPNPNNSFCSPRWCGYWNLCRK
jgi:hypothetical protein